MGINSTEVSYGFGQLGSGYVNTTNLITAPAGMVIVSIVSLSNATDFTSLTPEVVADAAYMGSATQVALNGTNSVAIPAGDTFAKGLPIYGRFTSFKLANGRAMFYFGR